MTQTRKKGFRRWAWCAGVGFVGVVIVVFGLAFLASLGEPRDFSARVVEPSRLSPENTEAPGAEDPAVIARVLPRPGGAQAGLTELQVEFSGPITGLSADHFQVNGAPATRLKGAGAGPYLVQFSESRGNELKIRFQPDERVEGLVLSLANEGETWDYSLSAERQDPVVWLSELSLLPPSLIGGDRSLGGQWVELQNRTRVEIDLSGWVLQFDGLPHGQYELPSVRLEPGNFQVVRLEELKPVRSSVRSWVVPASGTVVLLDASLPRVEIDRVDYQFSSGNRGSTWARDESGWGTALSGTPGQRTTNPLTRLLPAPPKFSELSGKYEEPFSLRLSSVKPSAVIRYTLDGSEPSVESGMEYGSPIFVDQGQVVKACAVVEGVASPVVRQSYLVAPAQFGERLPTLALSGLGAVLSLSNRSATGGGVSGGGLGASIEVWRPGMTGRALGAGLVRKLRGGILAERYGRVAFDLGLAGTAASRAELLKALGCRSQAQSTQLRLVPAIHASRPEISDWLVDQVAADLGLGDDESHFVNLVMNGTGRGPYRVIPVGRDARQFGVRNPDGSGEQRIRLESEWGQVFQRITTADLSEEAAYDWVAAHFDLPRFADYLVLGLFWGDPGWPWKSWQVEQDAVSGKWVFCLDELSGATQGWASDEEPDRFDMLFRERTEVGQVFEALTRNPRFRWLMADRSHALLVRRFSEMEESVRRHGRSLSRLFGSRAEPLEKRLHAAGLRARASGVLEYLEKIGLRAGLEIEMPEADASVRPQQFVGAADGNSELYYTTDGTDPVQPNSWVSLIGRNRRKHVWIPVGGRMDETWTKSDFDDRDWLEVEGLLGFDSRGFSGAVIESAFSSLMLDRSPSALIRIAFDVEAEDLRRLGDLVLRCRINDGFVAYLNGEEVVRFNAPEALYWNSLAERDVRGTGWRMREFILATAESHLVSGRNTLAVMAFNSMVNGPSFLFDAELVGRRLFEGTPSPSAALVEGASALPEAKLLKARQKVEDQWGPLWSWRAVEPVARKAVRFEACWSEVSGDPDLQVVQLVNESAVPIDLYGCRLDALDFVFRESTVLESQGRLVLVRGSGMAAFQRRWPTVRVAGVFHPSIESVASLVLRNREGHRVDELPMGALMASVTSGRGENTVWGRIDWGADAEGWERVRLGDASPGQARARPNDAPGVRIVALEVSLAESGMPYRLQYSVDLERQADVNGEEQPGQVFVWDGQRGTHLPYVFEKGETRAVVTLSRPRETNPEWGKGEWLLAVVEPNRGWLDSARWSLLPAGTRWERNQASGNWRAVATPFAGANSRELPEAPLRVNEVGVDGGRGDLAWVEVYNPRTDRMAGGAGIELRFGKQRIEVPGDFWLAPKTTALLMGRRSGRTATVVEGGAFPDLILQREGTEWDRLVLPHPLRANVYGRWPDGSENVFAMETTASPGRGNTMQAEERLRSAVRFNEIMADNDQSYRAGGDWLELTNDSDKSVPLTGLSLRVGGAHPGQWVFPAKSQLLPGGYLFLRCSPSEAVSEAFGSRMNTGLELDATGDQLSLLDARGRLIDRLVFGMQIKDRALGWFDGRWRLTSRATPGARNRNESTVTDAGGVLFSDIRVAEGQLRVTLTNAGEVPVSVSEARLELRKEGVMAKAVKFPPLSFLGGNSRRYLKYRVGDSLSVDEIMLRNARGQILATGRLSPGAN